MYKSALIFVFFLTLNTWNFAIASNFSASTQFELQMDKQIKLTNIDVSLIEKSVIYLSNVFRAQHGRAALSYNKKLRKAARLHSSQMVKYDFFSHTNPYNKTFRDIEDRISYVRYRNYSVISENITVCPIDLNNVGTYRELASAILQIFIDSRGHRENILYRDLKEIGCGISFEDAPNGRFWDFYFTQNFGARF